MANKIVPGPAFDAYIAAMVMDWTQLKSDGTTWRGKPPGLNQMTIDVPPFSTDIGAAWPVAEKIQAQDWDAWIRQSQELHLHRLSAADAAFAICLAALRAITSQPST